MPGVLLFDWGMFPRLFAQIYIQISSKGMRELRSRMDEMQAGVGCRVKGEG